MAKVKINFKAAKRDIERIKKQAKIDVSIELKAQIEESIAKGISPVKSQGRFEKYSTTYLNQIKAKRYIKQNKKTRPVNLFLSGELMASLFTRITLKGLLVGFDNKLAEIHNNKGAGKNKTIRRMLPTESGEEFTRSITLRLRESVRKAIDKILK